MSKERMEAVALQIKKRNGVVVEFNAQKIRNAIFKANVAVTDEGMTGAALDQLTKKVADAFADNVIPTVEDVQDKVEEMLIAADYAKTAKAYILYRAEHAKIRQAEGDLMDIYKELTFGMRVTWTSSARMQTSIPIQPWEPCSSMALRAPSTLSTIMYCQRILHQRTSTAISTSMTKIFIC